MKRAPIVKVRSYGIVPVRRVEGRAQYLLLRAYRNWDFPKGLADPEEDPVTCARRELEEETGLQHLRFAWGMDFRETRPYGPGKVARYYLAEILNGNPTLPIAPWLGRPEHHEFRWASFDDARKLLPSRLMPILEWADRVISVRARSSRI
jgi:bis(5'-nucleosidyl)-tetraphosphatase